ncbi:MAG: CHAD domain-containing protein [Chloroflexi bacterium]|nr:CHAD domain-containing protein [Chloroflexota bacterium]
MKSNSTPKNCRKADTAVCRYGYQQLSRHISSFMGEINGAKNSTDIEPIHQLRVFSRRISTTLRMFEPCFPGKIAKTWRKQIRKTARSFGEVRDLDVQIEFVQNYGRGLADENFLPGIIRLELRLAQRREKLQKKTIQRLEDLEKSGVLAEIQSMLSRTKSGQNDEPAYPAELYRLALLAIERELNNLLKYDEIVLQPEKVEELHKMRIAAKGLRYTIEIFAPIYPDKLKSTFQAVRLTQELLGSIHDLDVWKQFVPEFIEIETRRTEAYYGSMTPVEPLLPGLQQFAVDVSEKRDQTYVQFTQIWLKWKEDKLWDDLLDKIHLPLASGNSTTDLKV